MYFDSAPFFYMQKSNKVITFLHKVKIRKCAQSLGALLTLRTLLRTYLTPYYIYSYYYLVTKVINNSNILEMVEGYIILVYKNVF